MKALNVKPQADQSAASNSAPPLSPSEAAYLEQLALRRLKWIAFRDQWDQLSAAAIASAALLRRTELTREISPEQPAEPIEPFRKPNLNSDGLR